MIGMTSRSSSILALSALIALLAPAAASAHEHQEFVINGARYEFTVGSIGEPVIVDDKSGVELSVMKMPAERPGEAHDHASGDEHSAGTPVSGLEATLKVEVIAGDAKKTFDLAPTRGEPGAYHAVFFPTVATTLIYRFVGTIDGVQVDLPFTCNPAGHPRTPDDTGETEISDGVTRVHKTGAFGCPQAKADFGFPEPSATLADLSAPAASGPDAATIAALALGGIGSALGLANLLKNRGGSVG